VKAGSFIIDPVTDTLSRELCRYMAQKPVMRKHKTANLKGLEEGVKELAEALGNNRLVENVTSKQY